MAKWKKRRRGPHELLLHSIPSAHHVDITAEIDINLGDAGAIAVARGDRGASKESVSASAALKLAERGGVLALCWGRKPAEKRAAQIDAVRDVRPHSDFAESVMNFATAELGAEHPLARHLQKGVAFHHAGLSHDLRYLIELLIDAGDVDIVCGTTTLAQGVNFPIGSVIVETLDKPADRGRQPMSFSEFWNIAGRAGRAMRDRVGLVVFPITNRQQDADVREFLRASAAQVASALIETLTDTVTAAERFDLGFVRSFRTCCAPASSTSSLSRPTGALRTTWSAPPPVTSSRSPAPTAAGSRLRTAPGSACRRLATSAPCRRNASCISSVPPPGRRRAVRSRSAAADRHH